MPEPAKVYQAGLRQEQPSFFFCLQSCQSLTMEGIRIRLLFTELDILSDSQKSEGLKQSWLLLKPPKHKTINDLSSYLLHTFQLHASCPHGILLSMDGFILPPFESTCILKDNDIVSVKKKGRHATVDRNNGPKVILGSGGNNDCNVVDNPQIIEKLPVAGGRLLLANEAFGHGAEADESSDSEEPEDEPKEEEVAEPKEDTEIYKKRKASAQMLPGSKEKKHRSNVEEQAKKKQDLASERSHRKKQKVSEPNNKDLENKKGGDEGSGDDDATSNMKRNDELQKNSVENIEATPNSDETGVKVLKRLGTSRSARRKQRKRKWLREMAQINGNATVSESRLQHGKEFQAEDGGGEPSYEPSSHEASCQPKGHKSWKQQETNNIKEEEFYDEDENRDTNCENRAEKRSQPYRETHQSSDTEDEVVVPVEIRPGHIRFEPLGKEQVSKQSRVEMESFRWNGSMSKKKGQKWGQEKVSYSQKNDYLGSNKEHPEAVGERLKHGQEEVSFSQKADSVDPNEEHHDMVNGEKEPQFHESIDFNTLPSLSGLPKEGLVIAYRLIELSSTWTPEVSPYRVGKISLYNSEVNRVLLIPVSGFPIFPSEDEGDLDAEESSQQPDSMYNEDGSLEIDFSSLLEVRLVNHATLKPESSAANESTPILQSSNKKTDSPAAENGGVNLWEQISDTLKAKKAELSQESSLEKESTGKSSWSYRAMRGGALGPIMALLRSKNEI